MNDRTTATDRPQFTVSITDAVYGDSSPITLQGDLATAVDTAARLGYDAVEIQLHTPRRYDGRNLAATAADRGLAIAAIGTGLEYSLNRLSFTAADRAVRDTTQQRFREFIDLAAACEAVVFVGLCRGSAPSFAAVDDCLSLFADELARLAEYARSLGVVLVLEPIVFYLTNLLNTTDQAVEFLRRPGLGDVRLLLDTHHMFIEERDMIGAFEQAAAGLGHVHISDSNRRYPGGGVIDFAAVAAVLRRVGYTAGLAVEALPYPTGERCAVLALDWMRREFG